MQLRVTLLTAALLTSGASFAATQYYGGMYQCKSPGYLNLAVSEGKPANIDLWYYRVEEDSYYHLKGEAEWGKNGGEFRDGGTGLRVNGNKATWLGWNGKVNEDCTPFTLSAKKAPLEEAQALLDLLKTAGTDATGVRSVAEADIAVPPVDMLPELDRAATKQALSQARSDYWTRAFTDRRQKVATMPITGDGKDYLSTVQPLLNADMGPRGLFRRYDNSAGAQKYENALIAYRLAITGLDPMLARRSTKALCDRLNMFSGWDANTPERLQIATGIPFAFWSRNMAQEIIDQLRNCKQGDRADWIVNNFPTITQAADTYQAVIPKIKEMLALPDNYDTLVKTGGLFLDKALREQYKLEHDDIDLMSGGALGQKREAIKNKISGDIPAIIDKALAEQDYTSSYKLCEELFEQTGMRDLVQQCAEIAPARMAQAALDQAVAKAEKIDSIAAAREADWLQLPHVYNASDEAVAKAEAALEPARERIAKLILSDIDAKIAASPDSPLGGNTCPDAYRVPATIQRAFDSCEQRVRAHNSAVAEARCQASIAASGAKDIAENRIRLYSWRRGNEVEVSIGKLICDSDTPITIGKSGWLSSARELKTSVDGEEIIATIKPDKDDVWIITAVKGWTPPQDTPVSICLWNHEVCTKK
ncbi:hypothetical protein [uncultured Cardiobacterium sp.]|uniref:hypothetical protein n=1 Tax=uncultured Cardiobacterium sp. TaxID=417619 RepID=UPI00260DAB0C|nr:hypothetical protein [uncultured Cardiobacterium sp.]